MCGDPPGDSEGGREGVNPSIGVRELQAQREVDAVGAVPARASVALAEAPAQSRPTLSLRGVTESPASCWLVRQRRAIRVRGGPAPCREALVLAKPRGLPLAAADVIAKNPLESIVRRTWALCLRDHTARLGRVQSPFGGGRKMEVCG